MSHLCLSRHKEEQVVIRHGGVIITVTVMKIERDKVRLLFDAPLEVLIDRKEIYDSKELSNGAGKPAESDTDHATPDPNLQV